MEWEVDPYLMSIARQIGLLLYTQVRLLLVRWKLTTYNQVAFLTFWDQGWNTANIPFVETDAPQNG